MRAARAYWEWYKSMLSQYPLLTKATTSSIIMSTADIVCQSIEKHKHRELIQSRGPNVNLQMGCPTNVPCSSSVSVNNPPHLFQQDWNRTMQVAITGMLFTGPISHAWYQILEAAMGVIMKHNNIVLGVAVRMILDATLFTPMAVGGYFTMRTILESPSPQVLFHRLHNKLSTKYMDAVKASWTFWPAANIISFSLIPVPFRVLYNNSLSIFWNTYLTHLNSQRLEQVVDAQTSSNEFLHETEHTVLEGRPCVCAHCRAMRG